MYVIKWLKWQDLKNISLFIEDGEFRQNSNEEASRYKVILQICG